VARVTVVGGGVSGLSCAIRLSEAGHDTVVVAREYLHGTTSWVATAIWHLFLVNVDDRVDEWAAHTLTELLAMARDPRAGISVVRGIECVRDTMQEATQLSGGGREPLWRGVVPSYRELSRDAILAHLPDGYPSATIVGGYEIEVPIADMSIYLPYLMERLKTLGVPLKTGALGSIIEGQRRYPCDALINCTGFGARDLTGDQKMKAVKGQIVRVGGVRVDTYIADDHSPNGMTYVLPRRSDIILGGTEEENVEDSIVDMSTGARILDRCKVLVPGLAVAEIYEHMAGVRPCRTEIRLEQEQSDDGMVIHNYGHGGSGFSVSWGCAREVVDLVKQM
jgi:D-amino-acid oxidase